MVNENLGGHGAFHSRLVAALSEFDDLRLESVNVPARGRLRTLLTAPLPLPAGWDFDLPLFRNQVGQSFAVRRDLRRLVDRSDVIHLYSQNACPLLLGSLRPRPYIVTTDATCLQVRGKLPFRYPGRGAAADDRLSSWVERHLLRGAVHVVAQSEWARAAIVEDVGVEPDRVTCIRAGAPPPGPAVERPSRLPRVVFVGATMKRKGGWELLEVLDDQIGRTLEVVLVTREQVPGRPGLKVHNDVRSGDGQIEHILQDTDIFAFPSDVDMSPNAVLEAMAAGLPVVTYRSGALPEMVDHEASGYVVDLHDKEALRDAVMALAESPTRRAEYGARARQILATRFDRQAAASAFRAVLRRAGGDAESRSQR